MTRSVKQRLLLFVLVQSSALLLTPMLWAQPIITELNGTDFPLRGHVSITGSGFGSNGQVFIDGIQAWTSTWNPQRVVAYVPEQAAAGSTTLYVVTGGQQSNSVALNIHSRQVQGWFQMESQANSVGIGKTIELYDYLSGSYEMLHSGSETTADSVVAILTNGNISRFAELETGQVKARLGWRAQGPVFFVPLDDQH